METIVSDTTALIVLANQQRIDILGACFDRVLLPTAVYEEWLTGDAEVEQLVKQNGFLKVTTPSGSTLLEELHALLDRGEAEAIALAHERQSALLVDEKKGRNIARMMGIPVVGLAGVLLLAAEQGICSIDETKETILKARQDGFRLSDGLHAAIMEQLGRLDTGG